MRLPPRLRAPAQFAAVARATGRSGARAAGRWLTLACVRESRNAAATSPQVLPESLPQSVAQSPPHEFPNEVPHPAPALRFGLTVGKRLAARSVDRNLIRRVLREAVRAAASDDAGDARGAQPTLGVDLVFRLRAAIPEGGEMTRPQFKRALRIEADALLARVLARDAAGEKRRADAVDSAALECQGKQGAL